VIRRLISLECPGRSDFLRAGRRPVVVSEARSESELMRLRDFERNWRDGATSPEQQPFRPVSRYKSMGESLGRLSVSGKATHESHRFRSLPSQQFRLAISGTPRRRDGELIGLMFAATRAGAPVLPGGGRPCPVVEREGGPED
jgi:hypothetical protein